MCGMPTMGGSSSDARGNENYRQNIIGNGMNSINSTFSKFDEPYYADFERKNLDMALPDIARQKVDAGKQTLYGLARSGNLDSSTAAKQYADVENRNTQAIQQATDTAHNARLGLQSDVENERSNLAGQLNATADAGAAANMASTQAQLLTRPPSYSPITNIFSDLTGQIAANEQMRRLGQPGWGFGMTSPGMTSPIAGKSVVQRD